MTTLVEREQELGVLERRLAGARDGAGGAILIEAPPGRGKSSLLDIAAELALGAGMQVLRAQGNAAEREFPFAAAISLFESRPGLLDPGDPWLFRGPARRAAALLTGAAGDRASRQGEYEAIRGLHALTANLLSQHGDRAPAPLLMLIDDVQWADIPSLRFFAYLADRLERLPIMLLVTVREGIPSTDPASLMALRRAAGGEVLRPGEISEAGVSALIRSALPDAGDDFCDACVRLTMGNPFLLVQLMETIRAHRRGPNAATAARLESLVPEQVIATVAEWLAQMAAPARSLAAAIAVLGDGAPLATAARVAQLDEEAAVHAADALSAAGLLHPGVPLRYVQPLIRLALHASIPPIDRGRAHRRAVVILFDQGASPERTSSHLLAAPGESDPRAVEALRTAGREALESGAADIAVSLLRRALAEPPGPELRADVLAELGHAESLLGLPEAVPRLEQAISVTEAGPRRAELALDQGLALCDLGRFREASDVLGAARSQVEETAELALDLDAAYVGAACFVPELRRTAHLAALELLPRIPARPSPGGRRALAHVAAHLGLLGHSHETTLRLIELAWGDSAMLITSGPTGTGWQALAATLLDIDEVERCLAFCEAASAAAGDGKTASAYAAVSQWSAWCLLRQGQVIEALGEAEAALEDPDDLRPSDVLRASAALACCHLQRGQEEHAQIALSKAEPENAPDGKTAALVLDVRAQVRLAQRRHNEALADAIEAGRRLESEYGAASPGIVAWRSTAALAHLTLGDRTSARELAADELERARRAGVRRVVVRALHVLGLAERGQQAVDLLAEAVAVGDGYPTRIEHLAVLVDLGAALRRCAQRTAARAPLLRALELSLAGGASAISNRAQMELALTGSGRRRLRLTGVDALTPGERRVADVAAEGLTNRQIAEELFITSKTVEFHLRHIYRKLEIGSRVELAETILGGG